MFLNPKMPLGRGAVQKAMTEEQWQKIQANFQAMEGVLLEALPVRDTLSLVYQAPLLIREVERLRAEAARTEKQIVHYEARVQSLRTEAYRATESSDRRGDIVIVLAFVIVLLAVLILAIITIR